MEAFVQSANSWDLISNSFLVRQVTVNQDRPLNAVALGPLSRSAAVGAIDDRPQEVRVIAAGGQDVRDVARSSSATEQFGTLLFRLGTEKGPPGQLKARKNDT